MLSVHEAKDFLNKLGVDILSLGLSYLEGKLDYTKDYFLDSRYHYCTFYRVSVATAEHMGRTVVRINGLYVHTPKGSLCGVKVQSFKNFQVEVPLSATSIGDLTVINTEGGNLSSCPLEGSLTLTE